MTHTILQVLQNEVRMGPVDFSERIKARQVLLRLAVALLEKEYPLTTMIEPLMSQYGVIELVPDYEEKREERPVRSKVIIRKAITSLLEREDELTRRLGHSVSPSIQWRIERAVERSLVQYGKSMLLWVVGDTEFYMGRWGSKETAGDGPMSCARGVEREAGGSGTGIPVFDVRVEIKPCDCQLGEC